VISVFRAFMFMFNPLDMVRTVDVINVSIVKLYLIPHQSCHNTFFL
jgi:hypothetical protein